MKRRHGLQLAVAAGLLPAAVMARAAATVVDVDIRDMKYMPDRLSVKVGTAVRWTNNERRTSHSVLFIGPAGFESERLLPGESWQRVFDKPGSYPYTCGPHPEMKGVVVVVTD